MTTDVMNSFNHVENFVRFVVEAHIVYLAMDLCHMTDITETPVGSVPPEDLSNRKDFLHHICKTIVDTVWLLPTAEAVNSVLEAEVESKLTPHEWCFCGEGKWQILKENSLIYIQLFKIWNQILLKCAS